jgi:hypothetical protein
MKRNRNDGATVKLSREGLAEMSSKFYPHPSLRLQRIEISSTFTGESISLLVSTVNLSVIDCFVIERGKFDADPLSALVLSCTFINDGGRWRANTEFSIVSTRCLPLPSLVKSLLEFEKDLKTTQTAAGIAADQPRAEKNGSKLSAITTRLALLTACLHLESFETSCHREAY